MPHLHPPDAPAAPPAPARFGRVLAAEAVSNFGSMLSRLAIPWLATLALQATPWQMATLLLADVAAAAAGGLLLGAWVDGHGKRAVMLMADGARALLLLLLAAAAWWGVASFSMLLVASMASGVLTVVFELARSAGVAQRVAPADLPQRNAQLAVAGSVSETLAFALGGWLYQGLGAALSLLVDALSYAASALCLRGVPEVPGHMSAPSAPSAPSAQSTQSPHAPTPAMTRGARVQAWWHGTTAGLRAVATLPVLRTLAGVHTLLALSMALSGTSVMIFVSRDMGLPTGQLGLIFATGGLGAVLGGVLAPRLGRSLGAGPSLALGVSAFAVGAACVPMVQGVGWAAVGWLLAQQIVGDAGHTLQDIFDRSLRQTAVPSTLLARADAGIRSAGHVATLAGAVLGGALGTLHGTRTVLWLAAAVAAAATVLAASVLALRVPNPGPG